MKLLNGSADASGAPVLHRICVAGALGGAVQSIPAVPIEIVKVKLQTQFGKGKRTKGIYDRPERLFKKKTNLCKD